ncbi:hypothetical protein [Paenarthrobacter ilicis]|uniref:hypothetical protein n=1 Tax=Paenarthrobacter ilicis TaxID=43665 RepID=UPI0028D8892A|nr:hypothetical protein [Paenarthrobacter ilicis]
MKFELRQKRTGMCAGFFMAGIARQNAALFIEVPGCPLFGFDCAQELFTAFTVCGALTLGGVLSDLCPFNHDVSSTRGEYPGDNSTYRPQLFRHRQ